VIEQIETVIVDTVEIMRDAAFGRGVEDRRAGRPFDQNLDGNWEYERGRLWASIAPVNMPLRIRGRINPKAVALFDAAYERGLIL
jgi:hypothetical protein